MKENIHPQMREVVYLDMSTKIKKIILSTAQTRETIEIDGKTYPLVTVSISSYSHPFYNSQSSKFADTEGRIDRFMNRYAKAPAKAAAPAVEEAKPAAKAKSTAKTAAKTTKKTSK